MDPSSINICFNFAATLWRRPTGIGVTKWATRASSANAYLLVPIVLMAALLGTAVIRGPNLITESGIGSAVIVAAPVILATYALMVLAVAGRGTVDLADAYS